MYDIGRISAEPQGAAEMVPRGSDFSGAGIPPVGTYSIFTKKSTLGQKILWQKNPPLNAICNVMQVVNANEYIYAQASLREYIPQGVKAKMVPNAS